MCISDNLPDTLLLFEQICITIFVCSHVGDACETTRQRPAALVACGLYHSVSVCAGAPVLPYPIQTLPVRARLCSSGIFWICTCARMCAAVRCTPSAESRARTLLPDSLYSWTAAFPPVLRHRADRASLVSLFRRRKRGFNSASHFSRVFRSREKMTPSKFLSMNF